MDAMTFWESEVLPNLDRAALLENLQPTERGAYYRMICPQCGQPRAYAYKRGYSLQCGDRFECGFVQTLLTYATAGNGAAPTSESVLGALERLSASSSIAMPETGLESDSLKRLVADERRANLLEELLTRAKRSFSFSEGEAVRRFAEEMGFGPETWETSGLGAWPDRKELEARLAQRGYAPEELHMLKLDVDRPESLIGGWRDELGRLTEIWLLDIRSGESSFLIGDSAPTAPLGVHRTKRGAHLTLVAGVLDALKLHSVGVFDVLAAGDRFPSRGQLSDIEKRAPASLTFFPNPVDRGGPGWSDLIALLKKAPYPIYLGDLSEGGEIQEGVNANSYIDGYSVDRFRELFDERTPIQSVEA